MWLNVSTDGGNTFSTPIALNNPLNVNEKNVSIVMDQNSFIYAAWTDHRNTQKDVFFTKTTSLVDIIENDQSNDNGFMLMQNTPNPFTDETEIAFIIPNQTNVKLILFDFSGKEIAVLVDANLHPGLHSITLNSKGLSQGIYFYRLETENFSSTKKICDYKLM
jgi:dipeptidyl aminopeptidase/acylaminoacyl peptidase